MRPYATADVKDGGGTFTDQQEQKLLFLCITQAQRKISDLGEDRSHDFQIRSLLLYQLTYKAVREQAVKAGQLQLGAGAQLAITQSIDALLIHFHPISPLPPPLQCSIRIVLEISSNSITVHLMKAKTIHDNIFGPVSHKREKWKKSIINTIIRYSDKGRTVLKE